MKDFLHDYHIITDLPARDEAGLRWGNQYGKNVLKLMHNCFDDDFVSCIE